ncbi:MAG: cellulose biosynthesis protein BcsP [Gallionella sp.]
MKKSVNVDIHNLFRKFGGDAENYQEIQRDDYIDKSRQNWPLVMAMHKAAMASVGEDSQVQAAVNTVLSSVSAPVIGLVELVEQTNLTEKTVAPATPEATAKNETRAMFGAMAKSLVAGEKKLTATPPFRPAANAKGNPLNAMFKHLSDPEMKYDRSAAKRISTAGVSQSGAEQLSDIFTHLLDKPSNDRSSEGGLRNLLGRLNT